MKGKYKKVITFLICIFIPLTLLACKTKKPEKENEVIDVLKSIKKYTSDIEIYVMNDKQTIELKGKQNYDKGNICKLKLNNNREFNYKDGKIYASDLENKKKYVIDDNFYSIYKLSFIEEYIKLIYNNEKVTYKYKNIDNTEYMVVGLELPYMNRNLCKAELYINYKERTPFKVIIYNFKNSEKVSILYKNFKIY